MAYDYEALRLEGTVRGQVVNEVLGAPDLEEAERRAGLFPDDNLVAWDH